MPAPVFALVDCNNFYASCERAFQPAFNGRPVVVLSNNDGCVVARSNEAKALGIPMGVPFFQIRELAERHAVAVFSSNYQLYGDMSARVMDVLSQHCADMEVYSIDEAFLRLDFFHITDDFLLDFGRNTRAAVLRCTGIPVSIGVAPTKTLAKMANRIAKKHCPEGVFCLNSPESRRQWLPAIDVADIWGIGTAYTRRLERVGIRTADQLVAADEAWMHQEFGIVGLRLLKELKGFPCAGLEPPVSSRKHMVVSRSFSRDITGLPELLEAVSAYTARMGEKLRRYGLKAGRLSVFLMQNRFRQEVAGSAYAVRSMELPLASSDTGYLIRHASAMARLLYRPGALYKKAGIMVERLLPAAGLQASLFDDAGSERRSELLMQALDRINRRMGKNTVYHASSGRRPRWAMTAAMRSPRFTTNWDELLQVKA